MDMKQQLKHSNKLETNYHLSSRGKTATAPCNSRITNKDYKYLVLQRISSCTAHCRKSVQRKYTRVGTMGNVFKMEVQILSIFKQSSAPYLYTHFRVYSSSILFSTIVEKACCSIYKMDLIVDTQGFKQSSAPYLYTHFRVYSSSILFSTIVEKACCSICNNIFIDKMDLIVDTQEFKGQNGQFIIKELAYIDPTSSNISTTALLVRLAEQYPDLLDLSPTRNVIVWVKGAQKIEWLKPYFPDVRNIEDLGCPSLKISGFRLPLVCPHHLPDWEENCAVQNVCAINKWLRAVRRDFIFPLYFFEEYYNSSDSDTTTTNIFIDKMDLIVDTQKFKGQNGQFIIKELAYIDPNEPAAVAQLATFKPPHCWYDLPSNNQSANLWLKLSEIGVQSRRVTPVQSQRYFTKNK
ncbi:hypothetical protein TSAR_000686 [Trichomalopsis sarcophagae]|uniref:Uncharacterized protein n=1 Tax=Trichomalopsis sarcophagae TaxID=543379 RepID=A0A232EK44_9HYME|nr:hypothetical protein TSAR_000686 [Trichomalopsis sarcophagae]